jgi:hypothetical protein
MNFNFQVNSHFRNFNFHVNIVYFNFNFKLIYLNAFHLTNAYINRWGWPYRPKRLVEVSSVCVEKFGGLSIYKTLYPNNTSSRTNATVRHVCHLVLSKPTFQRFIQPPSSLWWWKQYTPLKRRSTSTKLHGAVSQKATFILTAERTINLTYGVSPVDIERTHHDQYLGAPNNILWLYHFPPSRVVPAYTLVAVLAAASLNSLLLIISRL